MKDAIILDIETCAAPLTEREPFKPEFSAPFNYKDAEKVKAAIAEKEAAWAESAALSSLTGKILCVGCWTPKKGVFVIEGNEQDTVQAAMDLLQSTIQGGGRVVGHCCKTFDLPFLTQRAWRLNLYVPQCLRNGKWWADEIVDLSEIWNTGTGNRISLDHLAKALGVGAKNGEGKDFGRLWAEDRPAAMAYVRNDIELIRLCAERMIPE